MERTEKPLLDRLNDKFKQCLNLPAFFAKVERDLKADVMAAVAAERNPELPDTVRVSANPETKNLYVNGFRRTNKGEEIPVAHVSLHFTPGSSTDIEGAFHGKSNTNRGAFRRYFFDYVEGIPKLVTPGYEGWTLQGVNQSMYSTLQKPEDTLFIQLVIDCLNRYLPEFTLRAEDCAELMDPSLAEARRERERRQAAAARRLLEETEGESKAAGASSAASSSSSSSSSAAPSLPPLKTEEEKKLVRALNALFDFYINGINAGFLLLTLQPQFFLDPTIRTRNSLYIFYVSDSVEDLSKSAEPEMQNIREFLAAIDKMTPSKDLEQRKERLIYNLRYLEDSSQYLQELDKLIKKTIELVNELRSNRGNEDLTDLLPYVRVKERDYSFFPSSPIEPEDMEGIFEDPENPILENVGMFSFLFLKRLYLHAQEGVDIYATNYERISDMIEIQFADSRANKQAIDTLNALLLVDASHIAELERAKEILEAKLSSEKKDSKQKKLQEELRGLQEKIDSAKTHQEIRRTNLQKAEQKLAILKKALRINLESRAELEPGFRQQVRKLELLHRLKQRKFPKFSIHPMFDEPVTYKGVFLKGGSKRSKRVTRRSRTLRTKRKTRSRHC